MINNLKQFIVKDLKIIVNLNDHKNLRSIL